ncbi:hypothetical protein BH11ARM1_BH11ARM1_15110 [soil metagenome]
MNRSLICLSLVAACAAANAQNERDSTRKMAEDYFMKADMAINKGDVSGFLNMFAPSYYSVDTDGKRMEWSTFRSQVMGMMKSTKNVHSTIMIKNVQLMDNEIVVWTQQQLKYSVNQNGKWMPMVSTTRWAENLKKVDGKWKFASSQQLMTNEPWTFKTTGN